MFICCLWINSINALKFYFYLIQIINTILCYINWSITKLITKLLNPNIIPCHLKTSTYICYSSYEHIWLLAFFSSTGVLFQYIKWYLSTLIFTGCIVSTKFIQAELNDIWRDKVVLTNCMEIKTSLSFISEVLDYFLSLLTIVSRS